MHCKTEASQVLDHLVLRVLNHLLVGSCHVKIVGVRHNDRPLAVQGWRGSPISKKPVRRQTRSNHALFLVNPLSNPHGPRPTHWNDSQAWMYPASILEGQPSSQELGWHVPPPKQIAGDTRHAKESTEFSGHFQTIEVVLDVTLGYVQLLSTGKPQFAPAVSCSQRHRRRRPKTTVDPPTIQNKPLSSILLSYKKGRDDVEGLRRESNHSRIEEILHEALILLIRLLQLCVHVRPEKIALLNYTPPLLF